MTRDAQQTNARVPLSKNNRGMEHENNFQEVHQQNLIEAVNMRKPVSLRLMLIEAVRESARAPSELH